VHDELQCLQALGIAAAAVGQDRRLLLQRLHYAVAVGAMPGLLVDAAVLGHVDVMPAGRTAAQVRILLAQLVSPGRDAGQAGIGFLCQQAIDFGTGLRIQTGFCHAGHQTVALGPPGQGVTGKQ